MTTLNWADAWVLYAVKLAQGDETCASKQHVVASADYINHAIVTDAELAHAVTVLGPQGLLVVKDDNYCLGSKFPELWESSGAEQKNGIFDQLKLLKKSLGLPLTQYQPVAGKATAKSRAKHNNSASAEPRAPKPTTPDSVIGRYLATRSNKVARLLGAVIILLAFGVMVIEVRYFTANGIPDATGSAYANWGLMLFMALPWVVVAVGTLQVITGSAYNQQLVWFSEQSLRRRIMLSIGVIAVLFVMTALAALVA